MFDACLGMFYLMRPSQPEKAVDHLEKVAGIGSSLAIGCLVIAQAMAGRTEKAVACLSRLEKHERE